MLATATRAPRLRLHRETVRSLTPGPRASGLVESERCTFPQPQTYDCDITLTCTQFNCAPTHPDFCISP
jgi:hypothetical protein